MAQLARRCKILGKASPWRARRLFSNQGRDVF